MKIHWDNIWEVISIWKYDCLLTNGKRRSRRSEWATESTKRTYSHGDMIILRTLGSNWILEYQWYKNDMSHQWRMCKLWMNQWDWRMMCIRQGNTLEAHRYAHRKSTTSTEQNFTRIPSVLLIGKCPNGVGNFQLGLGILSLSELTDVRGSSRHDKSVRNRTWVT